MSSSSTNNNNNGKSNGNKPPGDRPTLRLSISNINRSSSVSQASTSNAPLDPPPTKKRKFTPTQPPLPPQTVTPSQIPVMHQSTQIHFVYSPQPAKSSTGDPTRSPWHAHGVTRLYLLEPTTVSTGLSQLALHARSTCNVDSVQVYTVHSGSLQACTKTTFFQCDPLEHVLVRPVTTIESQGLEADSQYLRGAAGMTTGLRAASIASHLGELHISYMRPHQVPGNYGNESDSKATAEEVWMEHFVSIEKAANAGDNDQTSSTASAGIDGNNIRGRVLKKLQNSWYERCTDRRTDRCKRIAERMGRPRAVATPQFCRGILVEIHFTLSFPDLYDYYDSPHADDDSYGGIWHLGGLHALATNATPHAYTTTGVFGDHEGPRSWLPCIDSAATLHRSSHEMCLGVTAPLKYGLTILGMGEDAGVSKTLLHESVHTPASHRLVPDDTIVTNIGYLPVELMRKSMPTKISSIPCGVDISPDTHVIPPERISLQDVWATTMWYSGSWTPVPARSLGWAIGPWRVVEDTEYFRKTLPASISATNEDADGTDRQSLLENARQNGEGIYHAYLCPLFARRYIHLEADKTLLPNSILQLTQLTAKQANQLLQLDQSILVSCVGVPYRATLIMRDVLAFPAFRTVSYTQVWIPNAVHGGVTSGALHSCPECLVNPYLGGAIIDSTLLAPVGTRLPYYHGGRVVQFVQARSAIRGWIISALPLGGNDDVGNGYLHTLAESFFMSVYERGHGGHGEGKSNDAMVLVLDDGME
jgi:hypothetical protein